MSADWLVRMVTGLVCFGLSFYALSALDYERFLRKGHVKQAQLLYWLSAMALGGLVEQFLFLIMNK
jgi:uncharacterized integral membrane protein (TIGR02327 family)